MQSSQKFDFLAKPQFGYKQFCSIVGHNEHTIRTWITKHLPNIGYQKENGRMLYSGLDCIKTVIFSRADCTVPFPWGGKGNVPGGARPS